MAIKTGRYGRVRYNAAGAVSPPALVTLVALDSWKLSLKTDFEDVTSFGDTNKVYVPGMIDISGTLGGHLDLTDLTIVHAATATTPGMLELAVNTTELLGSPAVTPVWQGLAYLDADIDCGAKNAPKLTASFRAAAAWTLA